MGKDRYRCGVCRSDLCYFFTAVLPNKKCGYLNTVNILLPVVLTLFPNLLASKISETSASALGSGIPYDGFLVFMARFIVLN